MKGFGKSFSFDIIPIDAGYIGLIIPLGKVNDSAGNASEASNYLTLKYDNNIYVDSFDSLDTWTNSSQSSSNQGWYIVDDGSSGKGARSDVSGFGFGDKLSKEFDFTADVWITLKVKKLSGYSIRAYLKSNENTLWTFGSSGDPVDAFVEKKLSSQRVSRSYLLKQIILEVYGSMI